MHTEESFEPTDRNGTGRTNRTKHEPEPMYEVDENMQRVRVVDKVNDVKSNKKSSNEGE